MSSKRDVFKMNSDLHVVPEPDKNNKKFMHKVVDKYFSAQQQQKNDKNPENDAHKVPLLL